MKKVFVFILMLALLAGLCGCSDVAIDSQSGTAAADAAADTSSAAEAAEVPAITLSDTGIECEGDCAAVNGSTVSITSGGEYTLSGSLSDGCIVINTGEDAKNVTLYLNGVDITCLTGPAVNVEQAKNVYIVPVKDTENRLTSGEGSEIVKADDAETGAVIYSTDDLVISGSGSLEITGYINNGITCKDDFRMDDGNVTINAANNGIRANESVTVNGGVLTVNAKKDGIKATSITKEGKGFVEINGGTVTVDSLGDGISAASTLTVTGGSISVAAHGDPETLSAKALKSDDGMTLSGGTITLSSEYSKGISSSSDISLTGASVSVSSADDGIVSDTTVIISGGAVTVAAGNDGIKAGVKGSVSGTVDISGGAVMISAYSSPVQARGELDISGGSLICAGNAKSLKNLSETVSGYLSARYTAKASAGETVFITDASGNELLSFTPEYIYNFIFVYGNGVTPGTEYTVTSGTITTAVTAA